MFFGWEGPEREWGGGGRLFEFEFEGVGGGVGWALIRGWALIQFFCLRDGRLFEVGANSRLGTFSNKYGMRCGCLYLNPNVEKIAHMQKP